MVQIDVGEPKPARELLCVVQSALIKDLGPGPRLDTYLARVEKMVDQLDIYRPIGPDGKHGNRHTPTCGCDL